MNKNYIKVSIPLVLGIIGMISYMGYFTIRDGHNYVVTDICTLLPPFSFFEWTGCFYFDKKYKTTHNALWRGGFVICLGRIVLYAFLFFYCFVLF